MAAIKSRDIKKGAVLEAMRDNVLRVDVTQMLGAGAQPVQVLQGEQYEVVSASKEGMSAFVLRLRQVGGDKEGSNFLSWAADAFKIVSQPGAAAKAGEAVAAAPNEPRLNDNEEFVLVSKSDPGLVYRTVATTHYNLYHMDKNDKVVGGLVFSAKSGRRKKFKNMQTILGFLHNASGVLDPSHRRSHFQANPNKEREFHLHALDNLPEWVGGEKSDEGLGEVEARKYDRDARKILPVAVDFDVAGYLAKFRQVFHVTYLHGEAVSGVAAALADKGRLADFPFVFSSKFDEAQFGSRHEVPRERDLYVDLAIKQLGLKKKDMAIVNKNGFAAVAFATRGQADAFAAAYKKDAQRKVEVLEWAKMDPSVDLGVVVQYFKAEKDMAERRAALAAQDAAGASMPTQAETGVGQAGTAGAGAARSGKPRA